MTNTVRPLRVFKGLSYLKLDAESELCINTPNEGGGFALDTILSILPNWHL
jgi:hypothetical protein